jgi:hypothetical protein
MLIETFGIVKENFDIQKLNNFLYLLPIQEVGYVVCKKDFNNELTPSQLSQNLKDKNWCFKKAAEHSQIIQEIHNQNNILPLPFLTIFESENNIKKNILDNQEKYNQIFEKINNQTEYIVRVWAETYEVQKEIIKTFAPIQNLIKEAEKAPAGKQFVLKKQIQKEITKQYTTFIQKKLDVFFQNIQKNKIIFKNLSFNQENKGQQELVSRLTFLVPKNNTILFNFLEQQELFSFEISTPLPVFNFL